MSTSLATCMHIKVVNRKCDACVSIISSCAVCFISCHSYDTSVSLSSSCAVCMYFVYIKVVNRICDARVSIISSCAVIYTYMSISSQAQEPPRAARCIRDVCCICDAYICITHIRVHLVCVSLAECVHSVSDRHACVLHV